MKLLTQLLVYALSIGFTAALCRWDQWPQLAAAGLVFTLFLILIGILKLVKHCYFPRDGQTRKRRLAAEPRLVLLLGALLQGGILSGILAATVPTLSRVSFLHQLGLDRDRPIFEVALQELERAQKWPDAIAIIERRLQQPLSKIWERKLHLRLYADLIQAAQATSGETEAFAERAKRLAADEGLDGTSAALLLTAERERSEAGQLKARMIQQHFSTLVKWGDSLAVDPRRQVEKYREAEAFAKKRQLDMRELLMRLEAATQEALAREPCELPAGAKILFRSVAPDRVAPVVVIEVSVQEKNGAPIVGLTAKDFVADIGGKPALPLQVASRAATTNKFPVVVILDHSASTVGEPLAAAKAGLVSLVTRLETVATVKVLVFSTEVQPLTEWGTNSRSLTASLASLKAEGHTALFLALEAAVKELEVRPSPRLIVVFTDGQNTVPGVELATLLARCQQWGIQIHVVGLDAKELDRATLTQLATGSAGTFVMAANAGELEQRFVELSAHLTAPRYRIAIPSTDLSGAIRLRVGKTHATELVIP